MPFAKVPVIKASSMKRIQKCEKDWKHISEFVLNVPLIAKVICRQSHLTDWRSQGSNSGPLGTR